ncbi:hypothetical protein BDA96_08G080400 [Sorghum bicolor]|uniref:Uncharacterized protein n=1 Tax=Sorghum bicolor TaxID=4558 RepID=A0A921U6S4_SORBI|nr:hypothetical protein BDA96_08G080400 [Sorghum bicolor]
MTSKTNCTDPPRVRSFLIIGFTRTDCKGINVCGGCRCSFRYLMHSFHVFSSSTTTASMNFLMATVTARLYFFCEGLQSSSMRP